jgi:hypothetical protein
MDDLRSCIKLSSAEGDTTGLAGKDRKGEFSPQCLLGCGLLVLLAVSVDSDISRSGLAWTVGHWIPPSSDPFNGEPGQSIIKCWATLFSDQAILWMVAKSSHYRW